MRVSLAWLRDLVDVSLPPGELADRLVMAGVEVEAVEPVGPRLDRIVVGQVESIRRHPDADRLSLCEVTDGETVRRIVCGATNMTPGDRVALAIEGALLPTGVRIKRSKIRGQVSEGMLCSEAELGLGDVTEGILVLSREAPLGAPLGEALGLEDTVLTIKVYPNRPDLLSVVGIAREVAALTGAPLRRPVPPTSRPGAARVPVTIADPADCPRYVGRWVGGIVIGPSPPWLVRRLEAAGARAINAVVDVTNYVMLELGQPIHAFDADRLSGPRIEVRRARTAERLRTLDGVVRTLDPEILVIADASGPVALAGIMGGEATEVSDATRAIFLESASFGPVVVRRGARRLALSTEASYRFERRVDPEGCLEALDRACELIASLAIADPAARGAALEGGCDVYPGRAPRRTVVLSVGKLNRLLGLEPPLEAAAAAGCLERLELPVQRGADTGRIEVEAPSFRPDLERDVDLIEEVARLHGYDAVPYTLPKITPAARPPGRVATIAGAVCASLAAFGFSEAISYAFVAPADLERLGLREGDPRATPLALRNPLSVEMSVMRTSLVPGLLAALERNRRHGAERLRLFEVGKVFLPKAGSRLPEEPSQAAALMTGTRRPPEWLSRPEPVDFYDAAGIVEALAEALRAPGLRLVPPAEEGMGAEPYLHPAASARIEILPGRGAGGVRERAAGDGAGPVVVGAVGALHPDLSGRLELGDAPAFLIELSLDALAPYADVRPVFRPIPRFPAVVRDLALILDADRPAADVLAAIEAARQPIIRDVAIFDVYQGPPIPPGRRSLGLTLTYQAEDRTLTDDEVNRVHTRLTQRLTEALGAEVRQ